MGRFTPLFEITTVTRTQGEGEARPLSTATHKTQVYLTPGFNVRPIAGWTFVLGVELPVTDARAFDYALRARVVVEF